MKLIDWQLLVTHVIAFLLVLWLLRRFAWGPVLRFLEARRDRIRGEFEAIETQRREAEELHEQYQTHLRQIQVEARQRLQQAIAEGNEAAARIKERAQDERRQRLVRAGEEIERLEASAHETLRHQTVELAIRAAEKAIRARLDEAQHRKLIEEFIAELEAAPDRGGA